MNRRAFIIATQTEAVIVYARSAESLGARVLRSAPHGLSERFLLNAANLVWDGDIVRIGNGVLELREATEEEGVLP